MPTPNIDMSLTDWIDSLEPAELVLLLDLWKGKTNSNDLDQLNIYLKPVFKRCYIIKEYYDISMKRKIEQEQEQEQEQKEALFDENIFISKQSIKRSRYRSNCGRSQCELRHNGCCHSP